MSETIDLTGIGTGIPVTSVSIGDPRGGTAEFTKPVDNHTPAMFDASTRGTHIAQAAIHTPAMTYKFRDCLLSAYSVRDDTEHWTLNYATIDLTTADGSAEAEYDLQRQTARVDEPHVEPAPAVDDGISEV